MLISLNSHRGSHSYESRHLFKPRVVCVLCRCGRRSALRCVQECPLQLSVLSGPHGWQHRVRSCRCFSNRQKLILLLDKLFLMKCFCFFFSPAATPLCTEQFHKCKNGTGRTWYENVCHSLVYIGIRAVRLIDFNTFEDPTCNSCSCSLK